MRRGEIEKVMTGTDGRIHLFLKNDSVEYISSAGFRANVPQSGPVELHGEFPQNVTPPPRVMPYFSFTDVVSLS
jgi:hypothetical protein